MHNQQFETWLKQQYYDNAAKYRMALSLEIEHTKRIYGSIDGDVLNNLTLALESIPVPTLAKWNGNTDGAMEVYNRIHKPNYKQILEDECTQLF